MYRAALEFLPRLSTSFNWKAYRMQNTRFSRAGFVTMAAILCLLVSVAAAWDYSVGQEYLVVAGGGSIDIAVSGYSVPSFVDWNNDGLSDLVVGCRDILICETGICEYGKVRVYLNVGDDEQPAFDNFFFVQSEGQDLAVPNGGCLDCFPRVVYWDGDYRKDLLVGQSDGTVSLFLNTGTDESPAFGPGSKVQVGVVGAETDIAVMARATPCVTDWNHDGRKDLLVGSFDGKFHLFLNEGTDSLPVFYSSVVIESGGADLSVPSGRSSPFVVDLTGDGKKDILTGNTDGQVLLYENVGTDSSPEFAGYVQVESDYVPIDLVGTPRSRPFVCDWDSNGYYDLLVGAGDGKVHLYFGPICVAPLAGDVNGDCIVNFSDLAILAYNWLACNLDIAEACN